MSGTAGGDFAARLIGWQTRHGRHGLPWQGSRDPYRIWVSEIMLQQTQVATVIPYYLRFMARFPTVEALAAAMPEEVTAHWAGLGYYSRGRNLHRAARELVAVHGGRFPVDPDAITRLPGIGRSTANAIAAFAFGARAPILDGNVKRVLARRFGIEGWPGERQVSATLWRKAEELVPDAEVGTYTQALMDLGATVCTRRPRCEVCPLQGQCVARASGRTGQIPAPRPSKALPQRATGMLVLLDGEQLLLERRPPTGIWGGLLCPPEFPALGDPAAATGARGLRLDHARSLPALEHGFTHFRLTIHPVLCRVRAAPRAAEGGLTRVALAEASAAPVPAPVRRLLGRLAEDGVS